MLKIFRCRRSSLALIGMILITGLGAYLRVDVTGAISVICLSVAAANASQAIGEKLVEGKKPTQE